jgi:hypothetical protein
LYPLSSSLSSKEKIFWGGINPPNKDYISDMKVYDPKYDYRLSSEYHRSFSKVYLHEILISEMKPWPLILDEACRLLAPEGKLYIRFYDNKLFSGKMGR